MSANIEVCHIRSETREIKRGLLGGTDQYIRTVAEVVDPTGNKIIAQTPEFLLPTLNEMAKSASNANYRKEYDKRIKIRTDAYDLMIQQLLNDGWEIMTTDERGDIQSLKRQIGTALSGNATSPTDLLKQLASLRDAGILTEQEFEAKKAEILKRI